MRRLSDRSPSLRQTVPPVRGVPLRRPTAGPFFFFPPPRSFFGLHQFSRILAFGFGRDFSSRFPSVCRVVRFVSPLLKRRMSPASFPFWFDTLVLDFSPPLLCRSPFNVAPSLFAAVLDMVRRFFPLFFESFHLLFFCRGIRLIFSP